uniref:Short form of CHIP n=1 Tax=Drosophila melanogaster TaxID=7227 RepID=O18354_DROME|nr:short form of CHIP [Drosophila melanogaster]
MNRRGLNAGNTMTSQANIDDGSWKAVSEGGSMLPASNSAVLNPDGSNQSGFAQGGLPYNSAGNPYPPAASCSRTPTSLARTHLSIPPHLLPRAHRHPDLLVRRTFPATTRSRRRRAISMVQLAGPSARHPRDSASSAGRPARALRLTVARPGTSHRPRYSALAGNSIRCRRRLHSATEATTR